MSESKVISWQTPPLPYYLESGKSVYAPGWQHPNRAQLGIFDLLFVVSGVLHIGEEEEQWSLQPGQTLLLRPDGYHYAVRPCEEETVFYWVHFQATGSWEERIEGVRAARNESERFAEETAAFPFVNRSLVRIPKSCLLEGAAECFRVLERLLELSVEARSVAFWQEQQLFLELLQRLDRGGAAEAQSPSFMLAGKTEAYLKQNYQKELTNESLAEAMHFHYNYISRCMKRHYGVTPLEFLSRYRIEQAKLLLLKTEWPISQIAERVGFHNDPYFTSCFKKRVGVSPLRFRKQFSR
ncbi:AraC-type DNA-binding protein [Paenibacillus sp. UNCCL117]|uniref:helix-turn-helix transcriptional regulator n=1 Tax=unclassified Paenibacillus TaxID=185978 RepID=UPI0008916FE6|nr:MULTISPECIES: AraC family transcriptional regulator [unclassified Paenibacillus]SDD56994.1 AraC-type DNA-binding protein [Paenibacillus sp. cl123]SFW51272.1 AraC-type DNA-binding protein [Paenibacillus sp. UNCCL117]